MGWSTLLPGFRFWRSVLGTQCSGEYLEKIKKFSQFVLLLIMEENRSETTQDDGWRQTHMGRLMGHALRRFDARVLELMAHALDVPLALSNLAITDCP